eukprot:TRINITY_DN8323_c0_g1_i1.p1 TRINITY_DN8323_c0_g1~~TRINITY_DN8323_c0_g1_i1.p1  ORF type:complete len:483 (+),score=104.38 TRINITY_DN8323_c0_g1_i1:113-1561(+)
MYKRRSENVSILNSYSDDSMLLSSSKSSRGGAANYRNSDHFPVRINFGQSKKRYDFDDTPPSTPPEQPADPIGVSPPTFTKPTKGLSRSPSLPTNLSSLSPSTQSSPKFKRVTVTQIYNLLSCMRGVNVLILDQRSRNEFEQSHIRCCSINAPKDYLKCLTLQPMIHKNDSDSPNPHLKSHIEQNQFLASQLCPFFQEYTGVVKNHIIFIHPTASPPPNVALPTRRSIASLTLSDGEKSSLLSKALAEHDIAAELEVLVKSITELSLGAIHNPSIYYLTEEQNYDDFLQLYPWVCYKRENENMVSWDKKIFRTEASWPTEIIAGELYLGDFDCSKNELAMKCLGVRRVVDLAFVNKKSKMKEGMILTEDNGRCKMIVEIEDDEKEDLFQYFERIYSFMYGDWKGNNVKGSVLVYCHAGMSRSAAVVVGTLMRLKKWNLRVALDYVKERRHIVKPNKGFMKQLMNLETLLDARATDAAGYQEL